VRARAAILLAPFQGLLRMLSSVERGEFDRLGIVRLRGSIASAEVARMREQLWTALRRQHGVCCEAPETWTIPRPSGFQGLVRSGAFAPMPSVRVCEALDDLFSEASWQKPGRWGQALVTFPGSGPWDVPHKHWHFDLVPDTSISELPGVVIFAYLDAVEPRGGGTVAVTGSHRLVEAFAPRISTSGPIRSAEIREALLRAEPWLAALRTRTTGMDRIRTFMEEHLRSDGATLQVVELTGEPGDVVLMDVRLLHAPAPNCRTAPRLMLAQRIYRTQEEKRVPTSTP